MSPAAANRLAITSTIAAVLLLGAYATERGIGHSTYPSINAVTAVETTAPATSEEVPSEQTGTTAPDDESDVSASDTENKVRQAVRDLVKEKYSGSRVEGVFTLAFRVDNLYLAGADTVLSDGSRCTIDFLVRQYTKRSGGTYWRAESIGAEEAAAYREQLND